MKSVFNVSTLKDGFDAKRLIQEVVDADPAKVAEVITLVQHLYDTAAADLRRLEVASTDANTAYDTAVAGYDAAVAAQISAAQDVTNANSDKAAAQAAKTSAEGNLDAEKTRLEGEMASLLQVIEILGGLNEPKLAIHFPGGTTSSRAGRLGYEFPSTSDFSVEGWIKLPAYGNDNSNLFMFGFNTAGNDDCILAMPPKLETGEADGWLHWAMNIDSDRAITHYINGGQRSLAYGTHFCGNTVGSLMIGQDQDIVGGGLDAGQAPQISFDSLRVYKGVLSGPEIAQLKLGQEATCKIRQPWSNWAFTDSTAIGKDSSPKGQDFTVMGEDVVEGVTNCV